MKWLKKWFRPTKTVIKEGITTEASVYYKDENELLDAAEDVEKTYVEVVLPDKMKYNLAAIRSFGFIDDIKIMILTVLAVFRK